MQSQVQVCLYTDVKNKSSLCHIFTTKRVKIQFEIVHQSLNKLLSSKQITLKNSYNNLQAEKQSLKMGLTIKKSYLVLYNMLNMQCCVTCSGLPYLEHLLVGRQKVPRLGRLL